MLYHYKEPSCDWTAKNIWRWITNTKAQPELNLRVHNAESDVKNNSTDKVVKQLSDGSDQTTFSLPSAQESHYSQEPTQSKSLNFNVEALTEESPDHKRDFNVESSSDRFIPRASENLSYFDHISKTSTASITSSGLIVLNDGRFLAPRLRPNGQRLHSNASRSHYIYFDNWNVLYGVVACGMLIAVSCYGYRYTYYGSNEKPNEVLPVKTDVEVKSDDLTKEDKIDEDLSTKEYDKKSTEVENLLHSEFKLWIKKIGPGHDDDDAITLTFKLTKNILTECKKFEVSDKKGGETVIGYVKIKMSSSGALFFYLFEEKDSECKRAFSNLPTFKKYKTMHYGGDGNEHLPKVDIKYEFLD